MIHVGSIEGSDDQNDTIMFAKKEEVFNVYLFVS